MRHGAKNSHRNSWSNLPFKCFAQPELLFVLILCSFHVISKFLLIGLTNLICTAWTSNTIYHITKTLYLVFIIKLRLCFTCVPNYNQRRIQWVRKGRRHPLNFEQQNFFFWQFLLITRSICLTSWPQPLLVLILLPAYLLNKIHKKYFSSYT